MTRRSSLAFLLLLALCPGTQAATILSGEGAPIVPTATEADYQQAVARTVADYVLPAYAALATATDALAAATAGFCGDATPEKRGALSAAFADTLKTWAGVDFLRFGPMAEQSRYERFAFFPDVHGTGTRQLRRFLASEDVALLKPGAIAGESAAVQGLPALDSLLYSGPAAVAVADKPQSFRCALSLAVAQNIDAIAKDAEAGWRGEGGWATLINAPADKNPVYRTHAEAMTEILKGILAGLEQDRDQRLLPALGNTPADAKASRAPYSASGQALPYLAASADALERFAKTSGLLDLLPADQKSYGSSALFEFSNLSRAFDGAGPDLEAALADPDRRSKLSYATIVMKGLRDVFERHVAVADGLTPGFNSLDGD